ncbi:MAG: UvrD-helicase domain-containing protein [Actinomycetaceae bacterium]|nr:UvrD-helicase domain-containing protein [Actinomycetaceae bacterium]MDY5854619.1 UvrD-helicase domain-containing protein [Arcanobacterium sp.]
MSRSAWSARADAPSFKEFTDALSLTPTAEQRAVIESTAPALRVVAGAGSGKTATMSQRIAWHVTVGHVRPDQVLGLTFTRKAAGELAERVNAQLAAARAAGLTPDIDLDTEPPTVATYNSFASEIAASYALLIGEDPRSRLITEAERQQIMDRIVREWVLHDESEFDADHPFAQHSHTTLVDVALSLAAAIIDNGLTAARARDFLHSEIAAVQILMQAKETVNFRKKPYSGTEVSTGYNALVQSLTSLRLRETAVDLVDAYFEYKREHSLVEFSDQIAWAGKILRTAPEIGAELRSRFKLILLDEYQDTSPNQAQFLQAAFFARAGDEDQVSSAHSGKLDAPKPDTAPKSDTQRQDAEKPDPQGRDAGKLDSPQPLPLHSVSVCAVGDPNQAIYGWRGAGADSLADFSERFAVTPEAHFSLSTAFRSSTKILAVANALTASSSHIDLEQLLRENFPKASALERPWISQMAARSRQELAASKSLPHLRAWEKASEGRVIHVHRDLAEDTNSAMASCIAREFSALWRDYERKFREAQARGIDLPSPPTAAVLVRKHKYAEPMMEALRSQGLRCVNMSGEMFGSAPEIRVVRALLGVAFCPGRGDLLVQLLNFYALGAEDVRALGNIRRAISTPDMQRVSLVEALDDVAARSEDPAVAALFTPVGYERLQKIAACIKRLRQMGQLPVADIVRCAIDELTLFELAASRVSGGARVEQMLSTFLAAANSFDQHRAAQTSGELPIQSFLQWLEVAEKKDRSELDEQSSQLGRAAAADDSPALEAEAGVVQVLTVHGAKGLEWDLVAIPEMVHGEFDAISPGEVKTWHKDAYALPWPLRADRAHLPDMAIADVVHAGQSDAEQVGGEKADAEQVIEAGGKFWAYLNGPLSDYENAQLRRLAYVALTRARSTLVIGTYSYRSWEKVQAIATKMGIVQEASSQGNASSKSPTGDECGADRRSASHADQPRLNGDSTGDAQRISKGDAGKWEPPLTHTFVGEIEANVPANVVIRDDGGSVSLTDSDQFSSWVISEAENHAHELSMSRSRSSGLDKLEAIEEIMRVRERGEDLERYIPVWPHSVQRSFNADDDVQRSFDACSFDAQQIELWRRSALLVLAEQEEHVPTRSGIDYLTASDVVALRTDPAAFARNRRRPIPQEPSRAAQRGTAVHAKIAQTFHQPSVLDVDRVAAADEMPLDDDLHLTDARAQQLYERAMESRFAAMEPIAIEQSLEITVAGYPVRCVIDAVFSGGREDTSRGGDENTSRDGGEDALRDGSASSPRAIIVDWKTGRRPAPDQLRSRYLQLELYRLAWAKAHQTNPDSIEAYFYYLGEDDPRQRELRSEPMSREQLESEVRDLLTLE